MITSTAKCVTYFVIIQWHVYCIDVNYLNGEDFLKSIVDTECLFDKCGVFHP